MIIVSILSLSAVTYTTQAEELDLSAYATEVPALTSNEVSLKQPNSAITTAARLVVLVVVEVVQLVTCDGEGEDPPSDSSVAMASLD